MQIVSSSMKATLKNMLKDLKRLERGKKAVYEGIYLEEQEGGH